MRFVSDLNDKLKIDAALNRSWSSNQKGKFTIKNILKPLCLIVVGMWHCGAHGLVTGEPTGVEELAERANLVFKGEVIKVESRFAQPSVGQVRPSPYTFVTYRVEQTIKGDLAENTMTLRFAGGPYDHDEFVLVDGLPLMDVGDKDILFVAGNGEDPCPLVDCSAGRFREIEGFIFNEMGQSIELAESNEIKLGKVVSLDDVIHHKLSDDIRITRYDSELVEEAIDVDSFRESKPDHGFRPDPAGFVALVNDAVQRTEAKKRESGDFNIKREKSLNPDEPFQDTFFSISESSAPADIEITDDVQQEEEPWPVTAEVEPRKPASSTPAPDNNLGTSNIQKKHLATVVDNVGDESAGFRYGALLVFPGLGILWFLLRRRKAIKPMQ